MASLTIRNLDEPLKSRLRVQAAQNGRSMEEEVRQILRRTLFPPEIPSNEDLADGLRRRFASLVISEFGRDAEPRDAAPASGHAAEP